MARENDAAADDRGKVDRVSAPVLLASAEDLASVDLAAALEGLGRVDDRALESALDKAAGEAATRGDQGAERGYRLLSYLCTLHLRIEDPAEPWGPRFQGPTGRTCTASDFRGEQNTILAGIIESIAHPGLRARVADVVWYNDRKQGAAAVAAIDAYCSAIEGCLDGTYERPGRILDLVEWFSRAAQIAGASRKRHETPERVRGVFEALYDAADRGGHCMAFDKIARIGVRQGFTDWSLVAPRAERLAACRTDDYPMAVQAVWNLASEAYSRTGDKGAKRRCQEQSANETLRMREQNDSALACAHWTRKAIGELRVAGGFKDRIVQLRKELREYQEASLDEFGQFSIPLDLAQRYQRATEVFERLSLSDALLQIAITARPPKVNDFQEWIISGRERNFLSSFFGSSYTDHEGKMVAETPASPFNSDPGGVWFKEQYQKWMDIWRHHVIGGSIEPARRTIIIRFPLEIRHFAPIVKMSPFVPPGHEHVFALGFARLMQGDAVSAAYLLIPQLENSLRYVMLNANRETSKIKPSLLQEDRSLSGMLESLRSELEEVFDPDIINAIDLLFHHNPGPRLRHEMAHGKLDARECYHPTGLYASWMIYYLTCLPLIRSWRDKMAPAIERMVS